MFSFFIKLGIFGVVVVGFGSVVNFVFYNGKCINQVILEYVYKIKFNIVLLENLGINLICKLFF